MHLFGHTKIRHSIAFGIGAAVGVLYVMSAVAANADVMSGVSIAANGQAMVKGARVVAVTSHSITAVSAWGKTSVKWNLEVTGNTRFVPEKNGQALKDIIRPGEIVGFNGDIDTNAPQLTVYVTSVRNESVMQGGVVLDGTLISNDPNGLVIQTESGTSTIHAATGTILTKDGNRTTLEDMQPGETIKAFGTLNARTNVLDADRLAATSLPEIPNTGAEEEMGFLDHIFSWFRLTRHTVSIR